MEKHKEVCISSTKCAYFVVLFSFVAINNHVISEEKIHCIPCIVFISMLFIFCSYFLLHIFCFLSVYCLLSCMYLEYDLV